MSRCFKAAAIQEVREQIASPLAARRFTALRLALRRVVLPQANVVEEHVEDDARRELDAELEVLLLAPAHCAFWTVG